MNSAQVQSLIRWALTAGGPLFALLVARGMSAEQVTALTTAALTIVGALPPLVSFVWGLFVNTDKATIGRVDAMPEIAKIIPVPNPKDGAAQALADPKLTKVVSE